MKNCQCMVCSFGKEYDRKRALKLLHSNGDRTVQIPQTTACRTFPTSDIWVVLECLFPKCLLPKCLLQNVYSQNVYSQNVYCAKMSIPFMSTVPKCLFPKCLLFFCIC